MERISALNPAQYEVLNVLSCIKTESEVKALKKVLVQFLNSRLQAELDGLWDSGNVSQEKLDEWSVEHLRTPYKRYREQ